MLIPVFYQLYCALRERFNLNEKWFIPANADIGTGDSKHTWQAMSGFGYHFSEFSTFSE